MIVWMVLQVSLIYANQTSDDILLKEKLDALNAKHPNFQVFYKVSSLIAYPQHRSPHPSYHSLHTHGRWTKPLQVGLVVKVLFAKMM